MIEVELNARRALLPRAINATIAEHQAAEERSARESRDRLRGTAPFNPALINRLLDYLKARTVVFAQPRWRYVQYAATGELMYVETGDCWQVCTVEYETDGDTFQFTLSPAYDAPHNLIPLDMMLPKGVCLESYKDAPPE